MSIGAAPQISNFPMGFNFGVNIRGVPVLNAYSGKVIWVDSTTGADGNRPGTFTAPLATIAQAFSLASVGDTIVCKPPHAESITAAAGLTTSVAGVTIIGLGNGSNRPTITFSTSTAAQIVMSSANVSWQNFNFICTGIDAVASPFSISAAGCGFYGCDFTLATASAQASVAMTTTAAANNLTIDGCRFLGTTDAGTTNALQIIGGDGLVITNNIFYGAYTTSLGAINNITTACTNITVAGNYINNRTASSTKAMVFLASSTGMIANNRMQILSGTAPITGAAMSWVGANYYAATIATAGTLI